MDNVMGYLTLKTKIDTRDFTAQIAKTKSDIQKLKDQLDVDYTEDIERARKEVQTLDDELQKIKNAKAYENQKEDLKVVTGLLKTAKKDLSSLEQKQANLADTRQQINVEIEKNINKLAMLEKQQAKVEQSGLMNFKKSFEDGEKALSKLIKRVGKYVLAIFGIRSAFMAVRNAINVIGENDAQLKADIDYMKNALAYTLEPIIRKIVEWAKQLMFYIGYIVYKWTGKNIWENANKGLQSANKEAKKLKKTLAGFDEINVLSDQQDSGGGGSVAPSFDLSKMEGEKPGWLEWIGDNKDTILDFFKQLGAIIAAAGIGALVLQFVDLEKVFDILSGKIANLIIFLTQHLETIGGILLVVAGIVIAVKGLIDYINDPSWSNFGNIIIGIGIAVVGLGLAFFGLPVMIAGAIVIILGIIAKFWDKIEAFLEELISNIFAVGDDIMNWMHENLGIIGDILNVFIGSAIGVITSAIEVVKDVFGGVFKFLRTFIDGVIQIFKGDLWGGLATILKGIGNLFIDTFNVLIDILNLITSPIRSLIVAIGKVAGKSWTMETIKIPKIPRLASGGIVDVPRTGARLGNAVVGEAGAEGVLPLTDDATMTRLGQEIAKWIPINLNITNELDGRILSNRLETIRQNNSFSRNGG